MADYGVRVTLAGSSPFPAYTVAPWSLGVLKASSGAAQTGWTTGQLIEVSPVGEQVDIAQGGNYASVSEFSATLSAAWFPAFEASGASLFGASIEIGSLAGSVLTSRWIGVVSDVSWQGAELRISAESITTLRHRSIPARVLTAQEFPGISSEAEGRPVPIIYGAVERCNEKTLQYDINAYSASFIWKTHVAVQMLSNTAGLSFGASTVEVITTTFIGPVIRLPSWIISIYMTMDDFWINPHTYGDSKDSKVYVKITGGTGAGQSRLISLISDIAISQTKAGNCYATAKISTSSPWDTIPDRTSVFEFFNRDTWGNVVAGDEAEISAISYEIGKKNFPIAFDQVESNGIVLGDLSSEFVNGEDFAALSYLKPGYVYGNAYLSDGITTGNVGKLASAVAWPGGSGDYCGDVICRAKMTFDQIPDFNGEEPSLYAMFSFKELDYHPAQRMRLIWRARYFDDTVVVPDDESTDDETISGDAIIDFNAYTPACSSDGAKGNFEAFAVKIDLPRSVYAYESIRFGLMPVLDFTVEATLDTPPSSPVTTLPYMVGTSPTGAFSGHAGEFAYWSGSAWSFYAVPNTALTIVPNAIYTTGDASHLSIPPGYGGDLTGKYIKLTLSLMTADPLGKTYYYKDRFLKIDEGLKSSYEDWRKITGWHYDSGTGRNIVTLKTPLDSSFIYGSYRALIAEEAKFLNYIEREAGFAFLYGSIPADSTYIVDLSSGRTSSSVPITMARDAARDIFLRDLSVPLASTTAYASLPADQISMALVEAEDSAAIIARMCEEFNWVAGHDGAGAEVVTAWLDRVGTASADYAVANGDIVGGSISGVDATSLDDVATLPSLSWGWTQADGFSNRGNVTDCSGSPDDLTPENYLQTLTGFGDYATSLDAYTLLYEAWQRSGIKRSLAVEYRYGGTPESLYIPARMAWAASRKSILQFRVNDTHAAAAAYVGQRISVSHKRYATNTVYGTLVATYWYPAQGQVQLTVMLDPFALVIDDELYIDTIDASGATEQYIDQRDGTTEQYIEVIA